MSGKKERSARKWSANVTEESDALDVDRKIFKKSPTAIAQSLKRSAERSHRRKSSPYQSAMSMLTFYFNRAGKKLSAARRNKLEDAKGRLREAFGRPDVSRNSHGFRDQDPSPGLLSRSLSRGLSRDFTGSVAGLGGPSGFAGGRIISSSTSRFFGRLRGGCIAILPMPDRARDRCHRLNVRFRRELPPVTRRPRRAPPRVADRFAAPPPPAGSETPQLAPPWRASGRLSREEFRGRNSSARFRYSSRIDMNVLHHGQKNASRRSRASVTAAAPPQRPERASSARFVGPSRASERPMAREERHGGEPQAAMASISS
jgi:hypothetical protein